MNYQCTTLPSGLRVASERLTGISSVAVTVSVATGARNEQASEGGISHLLEHMAFKGTARRNARQIAEEFDAVGGHFNAYTSLENTVFHAKVLGSELPLALDILSDILLHSVYDAKELEREKGVILQEIAMHHDSPDDLIYDIFDAKAFPDQPLGRPILGNEALVSSYSREDVIGYQKRHYQPGNMVLSVAGDVDHDALVKQSQALFQLEATGNTPDVEPGRYVGGINTLARDELEQLQLMIGFEGVNQFSEHYYGMQMLSSILGGGMSSRLFQEIREKRGMVYHVSSMLTAYNDCGILGIYAATGAEHAAELPELLVDELRKMADNVTEKELQRVKNQYRAELTMARENPASVAGWIGRHLLVYGQYRQLDELMQRVSEVSCGQLQELAAGILKDSRPTLAALGPVSSLKSADKLEASLRG